MPVGFIFLGLVLIYVLFFEANKTLKWLSVVFCVFTMFGYFVKPINLGNVSVNLILIVSSVIMLVYFGLNLSNKQKVNLIVYGLSVAIGYVMLSVFNSDYVSSLNPYPLCFAVLVLCVLNLNNFNFVVCLTQISFILVNLCNLFVERGLSYVNFANRELFNLMLVCVAIVFAVKLIVKDLNLFKRRNL